MIALNMLIHIMYNNHEIECINISLVIIICLQQSLQCYILHKMRLHLNALASANQYFADMPI